MALLSPMAIVLSKVTVVWPSILMFYILNKVNFVYSRFVILHSEESYQVSAGQLSVNGWCVLWANIRYRLLPGFLCFLVVFFFSISWTSSCFLCMSSSATLSSFPLCTHCHLMLISHFVVTYYLNRRFHPIVISFICLKCFSNWPLPKLLPISHCSEVPQVLQS